MRRIFLCLVGLALLVSAGCDDGTPVAPTGTVLTVSANPTEISANGTSEITVSAARPNGTPVNPGTEIRLTTSLGTIDEFVETDDRGLARGTLEAGTRTGTATVTASSGGAESATTDVEIGFRPGGITLFATPSAVAETGSTVSLLAVVRDEQGEPLENAAVTFRTEIGTLESQGGIVRSDVDGEARDLLTITEADANFTTADEFEVTAEVGGGGGEAGDSIQITIRRRPRASFTFQPVGLRVQFTDTSTGEPTEWRWFFGDGDESVEENPVHDYSEPGTYTVRLEVRNSVGEDFIERLVSVN